MSQILFINCKTLEHGNVCVGVSGNRIDYIGEYKSGSPLEYNCNGGVLLPAFCNAHAHSAMTLFRGIGEDLPLDQWLNEKIFPTEAKLTSNDCKVGITLACAEMLKYGTASCNDMYFFSEASANAYTDVGFKVNFAPCITCFDDRSFNELDIFADYEFLKEYTKSSELVKVDLGVHSVYTVTPRVIQDAADYAKDNGFGVHIHISETVKENIDCLSLHGVTPTQLANSLGLFDVRTTAAHCVWLKDRDREIMKEKSVTVASCPQSNLKLGSGICEYDKLFESGINIAVGTDGCASNNSLNLLKEARLAALLEKGVSLDSAVFDAKTALLTAFKNGYVAQGRTDSGEIKVGMCADLALFSVDEVGMVPNGDLETSLLYSSDGISVMTMVNGKILYDKGRYTTIDIEKATADAMEIRRRIYG